MRLQIAVLGVPTYSPRPQTDIIITVHAKMQLWFYFNLVTMLFVSPCESQDCIRSRGVGQTSRGSRAPRPIPFLTQVPPDLLCLQAGMKSRQCPGRSEGGDSPTLLLLNLDKTSSILISLIVGHVIHTHTHTHTYMSCTK